MTIASCFRPRWSGSVDPAVFPGFGRRPFVALGEEGEFGRETRWLTSTATTGRGRRCDSEWWATTWRSAFSAAWSAWGHERRRAVRAPLRTHAASRVTEPTSRWRARPRGRRLTLRRADPGH